MAAPSKSRKTEAGQGPVSVERIETAAIQLFGQKTYPVVGMRDISDAVGILPGSLYVHIRKKEDILLRIIEGGIQNYLDAIEAAIKPGTNGPDRMRRAIVAHMCVLGDTLLQTRVAFHQWTYLSPPLQEQVVELRRQYEEIFTRILRTGIRKKEFRRVKHHRIAVLAIIGMLNSATEWFSPDGELSPEAVGHLLADSALEGLARQPSAPAS
ncbi:TetR/AcrR family transcriptional regulator [Streptomyces sp. NPDC059255]|uniref:TetR/AcrR family transcriptional regulator n=1 Tax=unclassified Streptomyces TaxID=2593676 RepID=UPI003652E493